MVRKTLKDKNGFKYVTRNGNKCYINPQSTPELKERAKNDKFSSSSITTLEDGTICVGNDCMVMRIPPTGNITLDLGECPDEVKEKISRKIGIEGVATDFRIKSSDKK